MRRQVAPAIVFQILWMVESVFSMTSIIMEAEDMVVTRGAVVVREFSDGSAELFLEKPRGLTLEHRTDAALSGLFRCEETGEYRFWIRVFFSPPCYNRVDLTIDKLKDIKFGDTQFLRWHWVGSKPLRITEGNHSLEVVNLDNNVRLDKIMITNNIESPPEIASGFLYKDDFESECGVWTALESNLWSRSQDDQPRLNYARVLEKSDKLEYAILEEEFEDYTLAVDFKCDADKSTSWSVAIIFDYRDAKRFHMLVLTDCAVNLYQSGKLVAERKMKSVLNSGYTECSFVRSGTLIHAYLDDKEVFRKGDLPMAGGKIGVGGSGARIYFDNIRVSPVSVFAFKPGPADFRGMGKEWEFAGNRVACRGNRRETNFAWGRRHWANYEIRMCFGYSGGEQGISFHDDGETSYVCKWNGKSLGVWRNNEAKTETITTASLILESTNRLALETFNGRSKVIVNGVVVADFNESPGSMGRFGIYASPGFSGWFGDMWLVSLNRFSDNFVGGNLNPLANWIALSGDWKVTEPSSTGQTGIDDTLTVSSKDEGIIVTKEKSFLGFKAQFRMIPPFAGSAGALLAYQNRDNFYSLAFSTTASQGRHTVSFTRMMHGAEHVMAQEELELGQEEWLEVVVDAADSGIVSVNIDGRLSFRLDQCLLAPGRFGFFARGAEGAYFDDLQIENRSPGADEGD